MFLYLACILALRAVFPGSVVVIEFSFFSFTPKPKIPKSFWSVIPASLVSSLELL